ncbi:MAG: hypothetical protein JWO03_22 [Bacteroidetes bacterium]|nr:hypothetical protein [Bacteroidota bacterium]
MTWINNIEYNRGRHFSLDFLTTLCNLFCHSALHLPNINSQMKRLTLLVLSLGFLSLAAFSQGIPSPVIRQEGKGYDAFQPQYWDVALIDSGDFNNDLYEDYVMVYQAGTDYLNTNHFDTKFNGNPRILVVLFGKGNDSLVFNLKSDSVILRANGGEGDPIANTIDGPIHTDGNIIELNYAGGVSVQWTAKYRFAYRNKEWALQSFKGTEYNTNEEDAPIKTTEVEFLKKYVKQDKLKTPLPSPPKIMLRDFKPRKTEIIPGVVL